MGANLSWRVKLIGFFILILSALLLFHLFYILPFIRDRGMKTIEVHQEEINYNIARGLNTELTKIKNELIKMAKFPEFSNMDISSQQQVIVQHIRISSLLTCLFVIDAKGWFVSGSVDDLSLYRTRSYTDRPFFSVPFEQGKIYFDEPLFYSQIELVGTAVSVPIISNAGKKVGVLIGGMSLNEVINNIANYRLDKGIVAYLVDKKGTVIAHSGIDLFALKGGPLSLNFSGHPLVQAMMAGKTDKSYKYDYEGTSYFGSYTILKSNGWVVVTETPMSVILSKGNELIKYLLLIDLVIFLFAIFISLLFARQITDKRKQIEKILRENEQRYRDLANSLPQIVYETDEKGNLTFVSHYAFDAFGYTQKDFEKGLNAIQMLIPEDRDKAKKNIKRVLSGEKLGGTEYTALRKDNSTFPATIYTSPVIRENKPVGLRGIIVDITEHKKIEEKLAHMATHDNLTGLPNRMLFDDRLSLELARAYRKKQRFTVMISDIDNFKNINDTLGHMIGDKLLQGVGNRIKDSLRSSDTIARMGGDEFLLLLPEITRTEDATSIAQKLLEIFQEPFMIDGHKFDITVSIGIAIFPDDGQDVDSLISHADVAMYSVKKSGRNNYQRYKAQL